MKKSLVVLFVLSFGQLLAQDSIRSRDIYFFKYKIEKEIIPELNQVLLFISDINTTQNEVETIIRNKTKGDENIRLFWDEKVTIESDLEPNADVNKSLRTDLDAVAYLSNFNTKYSKSEELTIAVSVDKISELKKRDYFYFNVLISCTYSGTNFEGKSYNKFNRLVEIKLSKTKNWNMYISGIRFPLGDELDEKNNFLDIVKTEDDVEKLLKSMDDEKKLKEIEDKKKIQLLKDEGDDLFDKKDYQSAIKKYREAYLINISNKDLKEQIVKTKKLIEKEFQEAEARERKLKRKENLRVEAKKEQANFNFKLAKVICDSLIKDYADDSNEIVNLGNELARMNAGLVAIESAMNKKDLKDAVAKCNAKIKDKSFDDLYKAEFYFRLANAYFLLDITEISKIMDNLNKAIDLSKRKHQNALVLRSKMFVKKKDYSSAIEDASQVINNDSRNHNHYFYRAAIHEQDKNFLASIEDYGQAVLFGSPNPDASLKKAILEYLIVKDLDVIETANKGIGQHPNNALLHYYRGLAKDRLNRQKESGEDFRKAIKLNIPDSCRKKISDISVVYTNKGYALSNSFKYNEAIPQFRNAVLTDSSEVSLYMLSKCYNRIFKGDSALPVINALIKVNPNYRDAFHMRGLAYTLTGQYKLATADYSTELAHYVNNFEAMYSKGYCEQLQKFYSQAALSFEKSAGIHFSDSAWYFASYNYYLSNAYDKAIACSEKARQKDSKRYQIYYIAGRTYYDKGNFSKALSEFEIACKINKTDFGLYYYTGMTHYARKDFEQAHIFLKKCEEPNNYKFPALLYSAKALYYSGKPQNYNTSLEYFNFYLNTDTSSLKDDAAAYAAMISLKLNKLEEAQKFITLAKELNPENQMNYLASACLNTNKGLYDDALNDIEKVMSKTIIPKDEILDEKLLKTLFGMQRFKDLKKKYYR
ncbi:MAG: hypothetical protein ACK5P4_04160 [Bacteroidota bacterium]|jgi:tetratricopeptide (TPR) repeat protein